MTEITAAPIFRSVEQALHFSFLMEIMPATQKSQMQAVLERLLEDAGIVQGREKGAIDFGGLTALEIRGQCAMVRAAVAHHLPAPEAHAVHARFGHQACKAAGVRGVRDYCAAQLTTQGDMPTLAMAWGVFIDRGRRGDFSERKIAAEFGLAHSTVGQDMRRIRATGWRLMGLAVDRLAPMFWRQRLVSERLAD